MSSPTDFDVLFDGPWDVANARLAADGTWQRFGARCVVEPIPGREGHLDRISFPDVPGVGPVEAFTLRLLEPSTGLWRIWWSSSTRPGHLDAPMVGRVADGRGHFEGDDLPSDGPPVRLRFLWTLDPAALHWEQARSADGGATWRTDWTMDLRRAAA